MSSQVSGSLTSRAFHNCYRKLGSDRLHACCGSVPSLAPTLQHSQIISYRRSLWYHQGCIDRWCLLANYELIIAQLIINGNHTYTTCLKDFGMRTFEKMCSNNLPWWTRLESTLKESVALGRQRLNCWSGPISSGRLKVLPVLYRNCKDGVAHRSLKEIWLEEQLTVWILQVQPGLALRDLFPGDRVFTSEYSKALTNFILDFFGCEFTCMGTGKH